MNSMIRLLSGVFALILFTSFTRNAEDGIRVSVKAVRSAKGHMLVSLYRDNKGYPDNPSAAYRKAQVDISNGEASVLFSGLPAGEYAVSILHDENDDQKMNKNNLGLPREGYGFSNNVVGAFGPPSWNRARFSHRSQSLTTIQIRVRY